MCSPCAPNDPLRSKVFLLCLACRNEGSLEQPLGGNRSCAGLLEVHRNGSWCFDCVCVASSCSSASENEGVELRLQARWSAHVANVLALSCIVAREPAWLWSAQCCAVVGWLVAWFQAFRGTFEAKCSLGRSCLFLVLRVDLAWQDAVWWCHLSAAGMRAGGCFRSVLVFASKCIACCVLSVPARLLQTYGALARLRKV